MTLATWDTRRFRRAYRAQGLTLRQVSVMTGIPYSAVRSYSAGTAHPTPARLVQLAEALKVDTTVLAPLSERATLNELRWHAGLTAAQLAERVDYSLSHTAAVLSGISPIVEPGRWTQALGIDTEDAVMRAWANARASYLPEA